MIRKKETSQLIDIRVLQLIDSLRPGGAERMAVSYANALVGRIDSSYLCCTRKEGLLRSALSREVGYLFLNKSNSLDPVAFWDLRKFIKKERIDIIHAHGTSWFLAVLIKISLPEVKLIWHDHYGRDLNSRRFHLLKLFSRFFDGIISVNSSLKKWAKENLKVKKVVYIKNFLSSESEEEGLKLKGDQDFKIICLANLRPQKDHLNLLKAFRKLTGLADKELSLHLIGKDLEDEYSWQVHQYIGEHDLKNVHIYGEQDGVGSILRQGDLGVLSSSSEGLPVALLEYGRAGLPVVCTNVGQCEEVIGSFGKLVEPEEPNALTKVLLQYVNNEQQRIEDARNFKQKVLSEYSEEKIIPQVIRLMRSL